jgi:hypothetical protein
VLAQIAKGNRRARTSTLKPAFIRGWSSRGRTNHDRLVPVQREQDGDGGDVPDAASIAGDTPHDERDAMIDDFKAGRAAGHQQAAKILGFGLNLQVATRQVFSGLQDSYESYYQAVKRSNRVGSTRPLNVHIPSPKSSGR